MKKSIIRNLAFAGTMAGLMAVPLSSIYLGYQIKDTKPTQLKRLDLIEELYKKSTYVDLPELRHERQRILSDPNFEEVRADYDSKNKNSRKTALYIILVGGIISLSSLGSFMIYKSRNSKNI